MSNTWNGYSDCNEKEYYDDKKYCMKQDKDYKEQDESWDDDWWDDDSWEEECCKKHDKCCKEHDACCDDHCCKKHNEYVDDQCKEDKCCKKQDKCKENKCCQQGHECCKKGDKCCGNCRCCDEIKELLKESYKYAFGARVAILAIFEFKNPCEHKDAIKYFFRKAKESVKCLFKILEKAYWAFDKKCFYCKCEAMYLLQKAIRNTESVAYALYGLEELRHPCCNECEYCEAVSLTTEALERIEDVVREIETLFKLFKKNKCKKH